MGSAAACWCIAGGHRCIGLGVVCGLLITAFLSLLSFAPLAAAQTRALDDELRATDEILLAAVHRGDKAAWANLTTPDCAYVEEGSLPAAFRVSR